MASHTVSTEKSNDPHIANHRSAMTPLSRTGVSYAPEQPEIRFGRNSLKVYWGCGWIEVLVLRRVLLRCLVSLVLVTMMVSAVYAQPPPTLLWKDDTVSVTDIAVSKNGQYVVAATTGPDGSEVRFYDRAASTDPKTPVWATVADLGLEVYAVAISADGESVVAAFHLTPQEQASSLQQQQGPPENGVAYWKNAVTLAGNPDPTWMSGDLDGPVCGPRCLDISDDGNYVAVATIGIPDTIYYYAGSTNRGTYDEMATAWGGEGSAFTSLDMSSDGNYLVAGLGVDGIWYLKNVRTLAGHIENPDWLSLTDGLVSDVAISDDGNYVAAATQGSPATVYYWAGARGLSGTEPPGPAPSWQGEPGVPFTSIDISCDGGSVIAGASDGVYFWGGARGLTGTAPPSWTYPTVSTVSDVAINDAGTYMAAANDVAAHYAYFFDSSGALKWSEAYPLDNLVSSISISCDGGTLAVGTEGTVPVESGGTAYLFDTGFSTPCCGPEPVGGVLMPANTFTVFAPWLAVIGAVGCIGTLFVIAKKRRL